MLELQCNFEPDRWSPFSSIFVTYCLSLAAKLSTIFTSEPLTLAAIWFLA